MNASSTQGIALTPALVALCERPQPPQPPETGIAYFDEEDYRHAADEILAVAPPEGLWVFAYGSLLWRPVLEPSEVRLADAEGWRREFCLKITRWRGSPDRPGLMMALRRGGLCRGLALQLPAAALREQLVKLLKREVDTQEDLDSVAWIDVRTAQGPLKALSFWAEPTASRMFSATPRLVQARMLARACGSIGSGAHYLLRTLESLRALGIADDELEELAMMVAEEIHQQINIANATELRRKQGGRLVT